MSEDLKQIFYRLKEKCEQRGRHEFISPPYFATNRSNPLTDKRTEYCKYCLQPRTRCLNAEEIREIKELEELALIPITI